MIEGLIVAIRNSRNVVNDTSVKKSNSLIQNVEIFRLMTVRLVLGLQRKLGH